MRPRPHTAPFHLRQIGALRNASNGMAALTGCAATNASIAALIAAAERKLYFPAALRRASLILSCQPGPPSWKYSSTSWSIRSVTCSLTPGTAAFLHRRLDARRSHRLEGGLGGAAGVGRGSGSSRRLRHLQSSLPAIRRCPSISPDNVALAVPIVFAGCAKKSTWPTVRVSLPASTAVTAALEPAVQRLARQARRFRRAACSQPASSSIWNFASAALGHPVGLLLARSNSRAREKSFPQTPPHADRAPGQIPCCRAGAH